MVATAQAGLLPEGFFWTDADNNNVVLTREKLIALNDAMMVAMVAEGFKIHERQREMKEQLNNLDDLRSIREMVISDN
ncbi:phage tail fiber assembly protein [Escherichia coli]|nr:phage tail fiber assembly protein [Escherichia coli]